MTVYDASCLGVILIPLCTEAALRWPNTWRVMTSMIGEAAQVLTDTAKRWPDAGGLLYLLRPGRRQRHWGGNKLLGGEACEMEASAALERGA